MREIKFRAWDVFNAEMFPEKIDDDLLVKFFRDVNTRRNGGNAVRVMQFTGLQDKNGVDIYESDLLRCGDDKFIMKVIWLDKSQGWTTNLMPNRTLLGGIKARERATFSEVEVIGNIRQNPELLESKQ